MRLSLRVAVLVSLAWFTVRAPAGRAQDLTPPYVANPVPDFSVPLGTAQSSLKLKRTFALTGVGAGPLVRFTTTQGNIDVALRPDVAPLNVANFLNYLNRGDYNNTLIHRSVPNFVIQGGGYNIYTLNHIPQDAGVTNEHALPGALRNTAGTIAMARTDDPNSATSEWFFNLVDNALLDDEGQTNGGYTVIGSVIDNGFDTVNRIAALQVFQFQSPFGEVPLFHYTTDDYAAGNTPTGDNLINVTSIAQIPLVPKIAGALAVLKLTVSNSNPGLLTATLDGYKLNLVYAAGATGTATITVKAKSPAGSKARATFNVTVQ